MNTLRKAGVALAVAAGFGGTAAAVRYLPSPSTEHKLTARLEIQCDDPRDMVKEEPTQEDAYTTVSLGFTCVTASGAEVRPISVTPTMERQSSHMGFCLTPEGDAAQVAFNLSYYTGFDGNPFLNEADRFSEQYAGNATYFVMKSLHRFTPPRAIMQTSEVMPLQH